MVKIFPLLTYTGCLVLALVYLIKGYIEHESVLQLFSSPSFEIINNIGWLLTVIGSLIQLIDTLVKVKQKMVEQILTYLSVFALISGFILFMIHDLNLTEVK